MTYKEFLNDVVGDRDPSAANQYSIRGSVHLEWEALGLSRAPDKLDNVLHASGSAMEGLSERIAWVRGTLPLTDVFGSRLLANRVTSAQIKAAIADTELRARMWGQGCSTCLEAIVASNSQK